MNLARNILALVCDFDDTLTDDSTTQLLQHYGADPQDFWLRRVAGYVREGADPTIAFLEAIADLTGKGQPLRSLTSAALREFGGTLEFYPGMPEIIADLHAITEEFTGANPLLELYVISGGFEDLIAGSKIAPYLTHFWGCRCVPDHVPATTRAMVLNRAASR